MRHEEYEIFEEGDIVEIEDSSDYCGQLGVVAEDQIDPDFIVKIRLSKGRTIYRYADFLTLVE